MFGKKKAKTKVFGVPLAESVLANRASTASNLVADVVYDVINYLEKHGIVFFFFFFSSGSEPGGADFLGMEGIYRVPGRQSRLEALRDSYDKGKPIDLEKGMEDPFTCADLLLLYLRSLPEPLLPQPMAADMEAAGDNLSALKSALFRLPAPNRLLLALVVSLQKKPCCSWLFWFFFVLKKLFCLFFFVLKKLFCLFFFFFFFPSTGTTCSPGRCSRGLQQNGPQKRGDSLCALALLLAPRLFGAG